MSDSSTTTESESGLVTSTTEDQIATSTSESATDSTEGVTTSKSMGIQPTTTSTSTSMEQLSASSTSTLTETTSSTTSETTTSTTSEITTSVTSEITTSNEASTTASTTTTPVRCNPSATFSLTSFGSPQYPNDVPLLLAGGGEQFGAFGTGRPAELFTFDSSCHLIVQSVNKYAAVHGPSDVFSFLSLEEIGNYNRICTCGSDEDTDDPSQLNLGCACGSFGERVFSTHYDGAVYATNFVGRSPFTGATGVKLRVRVVEPAVEGGGGGQSTTTSSDTSTTTSTTTTSTTTTSTRCNPTATFKLVSFDSSVYPDDVPVALNLYTNEAQAVFDGSRSAEVFSFDTSCHLVAQSQSVNKLFGVYGSPSNANFVPPGRSDTTYCTCGFNQDTEDVSSLILGCACGSLGERAFARYSGSKFILAVDPSEAQSYEPAKLKVRLIESEIEG
ncbi:hypothetical protein PMZ80_006905 [Knufia obscura]|uniref:Uncharacterized protein n=1 Tax=Knufia obscura TaxID=1635080 RepID=A0ABR0RJN7_9EURO|nr:hypothetical protein PMZ80_006905 [Knufia obscura]